jgi:ribonuclease T2 family protein
VVVIASMAATLPLPAAKRKKAVAPGVFSYYLLALSWAPDFCAQPDNPKNPAECGAGRKVGFVVHGLWPQADSTRGPENCGHASPVAGSLVQLMLNYIPTASLIQHSRHVWTNRRRCSSCNSTIPRTARERYGRLDDTSRGYSIHCAFGQARGRLLLVDWREGSVVMYHPASLTVGYSRSSVV